MQRQDLAILQCPFCSSSFQVQSTVKERHGVIYFGSVRCACDEFPIIHKILYLHKLRAREVLNYLKDGDVVGATLVALTQKRKLAPQSLLMRLGGKYLASKVLSEGFLKNIGLKTVTRFLQFWQGKQPLEYYLTRDQWKDALLFFFPLEFFLESKKPVLWLDIGSGLFNFYNAIHQLNPRFKFVSIEVEFLNQFLSQVFFAGQNVSRVCGDANHPLVVKPKQTDIVTFIDSLHCLVLPKLALTQLTDTHWLKKKAVVFITGIPEHIFLGHQIALFPVARKVLTQFFPSLPTLLNNEKLSEAMQTGIVNASRVKIDLKSKVFRYALFWSRHFQVKGILSTQFIPQKIRDKAVLSWKTKPVWKNAVY